MIAGIGRLGKKGWNRLAQLGKEGEGMLVRCAQGDGEIGARGWITYELAG